MVKIQLQRNSYAVQTTQNTMDTEQKNAVRDTLHTLAAQGAETAKANAQTSTGWVRWLWILAMAIAGALAWFTTGCERLTPQQMEAAHSILHLVSHTPCVLDK
jgi:hypothetical protein